MSIYYTIKFPHPSQVSDIDKLREQVQNTDAKNHERHRLAVEKYHQILQLVAQVWGDPSRELKYLRSAGVEQPPNLTRQLEKFERKYNDWLYWEEQRERRRETDRAYRHNLNEMAERLERAGLRRYYDFRLTYADMEPLLDRLEEYEPDKWRLRPEAAPEEVAE
jgi:hypothetical protein